MVIELDTSDKAVDLSNKSDMCHVDWAMPIVHLWKPQEQATPVHFDRSRYESMRLAQVRQRGRDQATERRLQFWGNWHVLKYVCILNYQSPHLVGSIPDSSLPSTHMLTSSSSHSCQFFHHSSISFSSCGVFISSNCAIWPPGTWLSTASWCCILEVCSGLAAKYPEVGAGSLLFCT